jgi:DUF4097 and DUF4098 domain-containing protein YvlB
MNPTGSPFQGRPFGHRGSLIGPLILIGIGLAFLISNLAPNLPVWQFAADYWPFLLIGWGAIRAVEIVAAHAQGKPLPLFGISGGEWTLAIFLTIFGSMLFAGHRFGDRFQSSNITRRGLQIFGDGFDYPVQAKLQAGTAPKLVIDDYWGDVRITATVGDTIEARGQTTVRAFNEGDAKRFHDSSPLELVTEGDHVVLRIRRGGGVPNLVRLSADLDVTVPTGTSIEARGRTGDYDITGITGSVDINADNAGVRLTNIGGKVRVETRRSDIVHLNGVKGDVDLRGGGEDLELEDIAGEVAISGFYRGDLSFRALAKPLHVENRGTELRIDRLDGTVKMDRGEFTADGVKSPLMLRSGSTDVKVTGSTGALDIDVARGDIELAPSVGPSAAWKIHTGAGDIELALAAGFELLAQTGRGDVFSEFNELRTESRGNNAEMRGSVALDGKAGAKAGDKLVRIDVSAGRGNIRVNRTRAVELERSQQ